jgi:hypothetical protein
MVLKQKLSQKFPLALLVIVGFFILVLVIISMGTAQERKVIYMLEGETVSKGDFEAFKSKLTLGEMVIERINDTNGSTDNETFPALDKNSNRKYLYVISNSKDTTVYSIYQEG